MSRKSSRQLHLLSFQLGVPEEAGETASRTMKGDDLRAMWSNLDPKVCFCSWGLKIGCRASEQPAAQCPGEAAEGATGRQRRAGGGSVAAVC